MRLAGIPAGRKEQEAPLAEFKNPNQQGGSQDGRSLLVMMFVMIAVFFGLSYYRQKTNPKTVSPNAPAVTQSQPAQQQTVPAPVAGAPSSGPEAAKAGSATPATPAVQAGSESTTVVENELYRIEFTN